MRAGENPIGVDKLLAEVPDKYRVALRDELERYQTDVESSSIGNQATASDVALATDFPDSAELAEISRSAASAPTEHSSLGDLSGTAAVTRCETFANLSAEVAESLRSRLVEQSFAAGTPLLIQGEPARGLLLLLTGSVDIVDVLAGERIDVDGAGSVMGEMSLLTDQPCSASVTATTDVTAFVLSAADYHELKLAHPELEIALSQLVSDRLGGRKHDALCGKVIGNYRLDRCINRGGMGVVYGATHSQTGAPAALKMLRHRFIYDDTMQNRFDQEASLLARLRHDNVVSYQENFVAYRTRFLVLDLCDGADLFQLLRKHGPLNESATRSILGQIAKGLQYAHQAGVIHRDLKPGNVLVDRKGVVKLTDFGLSKLLESEVPAGKAVGTPAYMPPEQFRSENVGPASDWYALGCLACEMLTGRILFRGSDWRNLYEQKLLSKTSSQWPPITVSPELRAVIVGLLAQQPEDRVFDYESVIGWADTAPLQLIQL